MAEKRAFRREESLVAERITRDLVKPFLESKGYTKLDDVRTRHGSSQSQHVSAVDETGQPVQLHVQICWRRQPGDGRQFSAAQLMMKIKDDDWDGSIRDKVARTASHGATHSLLVQAVGPQILHAARIPLDAILPIWKQQRIVSDRLIKSGVLGRQHKNHAANGNSPTLWLQDDRMPDAHKVADVLWNYQGVINVAALPDVSPTSLVPVDDTFDDIVVDYSHFGSDGAPRTRVQRSSVRRDPRVRKIVLDRAKGKCERESCEAKRGWPGFLDVHHILGVETSDRVWNCVALCPNCHRESHFSPNGEAVNAELLAFAASFKK